MERDWATRHLSRDFNGAQTSVKSSLCQQTAQSQSGTFSDWVKAKLSDQRNTKRHPTLMNNVVVDASLMLLLLSKQKIDKKLLFSSSIKK